MKIHKWVGNRNSAVNGIAVVVVEPDEVADVEAMVQLVDDYPTFGYTVKLLTTDNEPKMTFKKLYGHDTPEPQFGFGNAASNKGKRRYYEVFVHRD